MSSDVTDVGPHDLVTLIIVLRVESKMIWKEKENKKWKEKGKNNLESTTFSFDKIDNSIPMLMILENYQHTQVSLPFPILKE